MSIPFTQYLLPDGRTKEVTVERPAEVEALAHAFIAKGGKFDIEMLRTGDISMTAELPNVDEDEGADEKEDLIAIEVCTNGPAVPDAVDRLVRKAAESLA